MLRTFAALCILLLLASPAWAQINPGACGLTSATACYTQGGGTGASSVNLTGINGTTPLAGAGATGAGSLRTTQAQDTTTIAGSAPGTAGTPSANVVTVQGPTSGGTPVTVSAASLPLPTGAATAANQEVTAAGSSASSAQGVQGVTGGVPLPVSGNVGGYAGKVSQAVGTVAASSHAAGTSIGGLTAVAIARTSGGTGVLLNATFNSGGGSTGSYVERVYNSTPAGGSYACTDNSAFVDTAAARALLVVPPFTVTPAAPASTTGDATTYGTTFLDAAFATSGNSNIYVCVVTVAANTADEGSPPVLGFGVVQN